MRASRKPVICFNNINVLSMDTVSGIFVGDNFQQLWSSKAKSNTGFGTIVGEDNIVKNPVNYVYDPDYIDKVSNY